MSLFSSNFSSLICRCSLVLNSILTVPAPENVVVISSQKLRKAVEVHVEQSDRALGTATIPARVTTPLVQVEVATSVVLGSTPPVLDFMEVDPFAKVPSRAPKPFEAAFCGTDNAQIMELDSVIFFSSIAEGMFANIHLN